MQRVDIESPNTDTKDILERLKVLKKQSMGPRSAYDTIENVRASFQVGSLGLGVIKQLSNETSLLGTITVEGFCTLLACVIFATELANVISAQCAGIAQKANKRFFGGYSTYLAFRSVSILASFTGIALIASEMPAGSFNAGNGTTTNNSTQNYGSRATVGIFLLACNLFANNQLNKRYDSPGDAKKNKKAKTDEGSEKGADNKLVI